MQNIEKDGFVVLRNVYSREQIDKFRELYSREWGELYQSFDKSDWLKIQYKHKDTETFFLDKVLYEGKLMTTIKDHQVIDLGGGRYNFKSVIDSEMFITDEIAEIIKHFLVRNYSPIIGGLPVLPGAGDGLWHRDIGSLFEYEGIDLAAPPFYMTMIIPLCDVAENNGGTEFIPGTHQFNFTQNGITSVQSLAKWAESQQREQAIMRAGDVCLFNGAVLHRGLANRSSSTRDALFIVFRKNWYSDDNPNDYNLFLHAYL